MRDSKAQVYPAFDLCPSPLIPSLYRGSGPTNCPAAVVIRDGKIVDVVRAPRSADLPRERREVYGLICPGFVDLQINGAFGVEVGETIVGGESVYRREEGL